MLEYSETISIPFPMKEERVELMSTDGLLRFFVREMKSEHYSGVQVNGVQVTVVYTPRNFSDPL